MSDLGSYAHPMAENEILDLGHPLRWRLTRLVLGDPASSVAQVVQCAAEELDEVVRRLTVALRKGAPLLVLLHAAKGSFSDSQAVVVTFKERRLANIVLAAVKLAPTKDAAGVARTASELVINGLIDQLLTRAKKESRFCHSKSQDELRASLRLEFEKRQDDFRVTLEASLRGAAVKPIKRMFASTPRLQLGQVARLSLIAPLAEQSHVR
jgi:hypothetical protein